MSTNHLDAYSQLIKALRVLPNVGAKTAQRMAHVLLQQNREGAAELLTALDTALKQVHNCTLCNTFCEGDLCAICTDEQRDKTRLMIVQMPARLPQKATPLLIYCLNYSRNNLIKSVD